MLHLMESTAGTAAASTEASEPAVLVISPWSSFWSLGPGMGVRDEVEVITGFIRAGFRVHLLRPRPVGEIDHELLPGLTVHNLPGFLDRPLPKGRVLGRLGRLLNYKLFTLLAIVKGLHIFHRHRPSIIIGHSATSAPAIYLLGKLGRVPTVVKIFGVMYLGVKPAGGIRDWLRDPQTMVAYELPVDRLIVFDDGTKGDELALRMRVKPGRFLFWRNGVNLEWAESTLNRLEARERLGLPKKDFLVVSVARFDPCKGITDLIRAFSRAVRESAVSMRLVLVGDGAQRPELESLAAELGLEERVVFAGAVRQEQVLEYLKAADVFASASDMTNAAIPTCEAMTCGLPVVVTDSGSTYRIVRHMETGILVRGGEMPEGMSRAFVQLASKPALRESLGENAQAFALQHFWGWRERVREEIELIRDLIVERD